MPVDPIRLQPCTVDDAATLALIGGATFLDAFAGVLDGESIVAHCHKQHNADVYRHYFEDAQTQAWLATVEPGHAPIGYAMLTAPDLPLDDLTDHDIELKRIYVLTRFQRFGVGALLLERATMHATSAAKQRLLLGVHAENARALAFYRKNGFQQVGVRNFQVGRSTFHDLVLGKPL